jgi:hypothetical protein
VEIDVLALLTRNSRYVYRLSNAPPRNLGVSIVWKQGHSSAKVLGF